MQFTHIPLLTTPSPATGLSYLGSVVYLHNPPTERRRGESERDGTIGVVFVEQARLSFHTPLSASCCLSRSGLRCVYVRVNVCVDWPCLSIACVKVSRPAGSDMKEPLKSLWRTNGSLMQCSRFQDTHAQRPMPHTHWLTRSVTHAGTPHPQPTIHKSPSLHTPVGQA